MSKKILLNAEGKVLTSNDKVLKAPESTLKKLLDATKSCSYLFYGYKGTSVDDLIKYDDTEKVEKMGYMFYLCYSLKSIPLLNTSKVTNMNSMFNSCENLTTIPQLDTRNVTSMSNMFYNCKKLQTVPQLDTSKVTGMQGIFQNCTNLQTIPQLDTSKVTDMRQMFENCKLQTIDITSMDKITSTSNSSYICRYCYSLTKLIIRTMTVIPSLNSNAFTNCYHFTGTVNKTYNPTGAKDGRIYVPDNMVEQLKSATNWSTYADIIVPLSTLAE